MGSQRNSISCWTQLTSPVMREIYACATETTEGILPIGVQRSTLQRGGVEMANPSSGGDGDRGGSSPDRSPNDDRSDGMNPNNPAYDADQENREKQAEDDEEDDD